MYKFEIVISVFEDGLFRVRDRIELDCLDPLELDPLLVRIEQKLIEIKESKYRIAEDDDIPF